MSGNPRVGVDLRVEGLTKEYTSSGYVVRPLDDLTFTAAAGELAVLLGPSGSGKTTLLSCLGGILSPTSGSIHLGDVDITTLKGSDLDRHRRNDVGFVFQSFNLVPSLSARENVAVPLLLRGEKKRSAFERADALLDRVGLADRAGHKPSQLSGGQQQRVAVARGLIGDPALLLADEPTANLDHVQAEAVIALLRELRSEGRVIVVSTHDARLVPVADRIVRMGSDAEASEDPPTVVEYTAGETIVRQGDPAQLVYTIEAGEVEVVIELADGTEEHRAVLGSGRYFGELGALLGFPRSATVRATTDVRLTSYNPSDFREMVLHEPG